MAALSFEKYDLWLIRWTLFRESRGSFYMGTTSKHNAKVQSESAFARKGRQRLRHVPSQEPT